MFHFSGVDFGIPSGLPYYLVLGAMCGFAAIGLTKFLYWVEDLFEHLPISDLWHPAIGALALGIIGFFVPRVLGVGYDTISGILNNQFTLHVLIILLVFKMLAMVISLGSGTSGGLLAPTFMSSAALGGAFAMLVNHFIPSAHLSPGAYALVAMGAVFGAASRSTFAFIVFAFEITRDYNSVLPLMLVCVIADIIAIRFLPNSIMTEKLARRGLNTHQDFEANVMKQVKVSEVMFSDVPTISPQMKVSEAVDRIASGDPDLARHHALPIVDERGQLSGMVTQSDLLAMLEVDGGRDKTVLEAGTRALVVCYPDENVFDAMTRMLRNDIGRLPVVGREDSHHLIGYISRSSVMSAWGKHLDDESNREHGWIKKYFKGGSNLPPQR
jgi:CBS domain-containing protein